MRKGLWVLLFSVWVFMESPWFQLSKPCLWVQVSLENNSQFSVGWDNFRIWLTLMWNLRECKGLNISYGEFQPIVTLFVYSTPQPWEEMDASNSWVFPGFQSMSSPYPDCPFIPCRHILSFSYNFYFMLCVFQIFLCLTLLLFLFLFFLL